MKYQITIINQFLSLKLLIRRSIIYWITVYFCFRVLGYFQSGAIALSIYYLLQFIPTLWIHLEYYFTNKNDVLIIHPIEETISFNQQELIHFNQVEKIFLVLTSAMYRNSTLRVLPFENYHYAIIKLKDGQTHIFTSLMDFKVRETVELIKGVPIYKRWRFIPSRLLFRYWKEFWS